MRLLVVGAGSTGGYYGGRLAAAGADVTFLVRPKRAAQLRETGLRIKSPHGDATVTPKIVIPGEITGHFDAVLLAVKGYQLDAALDDITPAIGPDTIILPVLNGMQHMEVMAKRFSPRNLGGCALKIATILEDDGTVVQLNPMQDLAYGELDGSNTPRIKALDELMHRASVGARLSSTIHSEMWQKWIMLAGLGAITCLMRSTVGEIEATTGGKEFVLAILDEIIAIVNRIGQPASDDFVKAAREQLTAKGSPLASSMARDVQRARPIEVENVIGDLVRHAAKLGLPAPLLSAAYVHLQVYQRRVAPAV
jgi:2-dehydropantoate 2-reductase